MDDRVREIEEGKFDEEINRMTKLDEKKLRKLYNERDIEPQ